MSKPERFCRRLMEDWAFALAMAFYGGGFVGCIMVICERYG